MHYSQKNSGFRRNRRATEEVLHGTDWESVNYSLTKLQCNEDEITGLSVNDKYLVVQYHIEGGIDVYDRHTFQHLFRLNGHEYGGQCVELSDSILFSASMDFSLKSWNLDTHKQSDSITDHCDYVQCLSIKIRYMSHFSNNDWVKWNTIILFPENQLTLLQQEERETGKFLFMKQPKVENWQNCIALEVTQVNVMQV